METSRGALMIVGAFSVLVAGVCVSIDLFSNLNAQKEFDKQLWANPEERTPMARKLVLDSTLVGMGKDAVVEKLGTDYRHPGYHHKDSTVPEYQISDSYSYLWIKLNDSRVVQVDFSCYD